MKSKYSFSRMAFVGVVAALGFEAPHAVAHTPSNPPSGFPALAYTLEAAVSEVTVTDLSVQSSTLGTFLTIRFTSSGSVCATNTNVVYILRSDHPEQFDHWVRVAQAAQLSGKRLKYTSGKRTSTSNCYTWYMTLEN